MIELSPLKAPKPLVSSAGCRTRCDGHPEPRLKRGAKDARVIVRGRVSASGAALGVSETTAGPFHSPTIYKARKIGDFASL